MNPKYLLLIGGAGNLGRSFVNKFKPSYQVISLDLKENPDSHHNILLKSGIPTKESITQLHDKVSSISKKYDSIICAAGGWCGGSINSEEIFNQIEKMNSMNLIPSLLASQLASKFLNSQGILVLTGAALPFKEPSPNMLAYALSKTAVHSLALNMAQCDTLPKDSIVTCILPEVLDTPDNRKGMPDADFTKWTSPDDVAGLVKMWADGNNRPKNGSFAIMKKVNEMVVPEFV